MEIVKVTEENETILLTYMMKYQGEIPFYFKTSPELLRQYILHDTLNNHELMMTNKLYIAIDKNQCLGMVQFGIQGVDFNENGEFLLRPMTGNIRHLFFDVTSVGRILLKKAMDYFESEMINEIYAFNHVAGLSCYSKHGKLHESMSRVHDLLLANQFNVRHENVYYILNIKKSEQLNEVDINLEGSFILQIKKESDRDIVKLVDEKNNNKVIGISQVTKLSLWSKDKNDNKLYMRYIHIDEEEQGKGYSKLFISILCQHYLKDGIEFIHCDTSLFNDVAQNLYERLGFKNCGITRDYKVITCNCSVE